MSQLFSRVFLQILDSSIAEDFTVRHIFEDLLKLCDHRNGVVDMTRQALSRRLNVPMETIDSAILKLESPDENSRDQEFEGRRIERLDSHRDWGWVILNWKKYDEIRTKADACIRVERSRDKKNGPETLVVELPEKFQTERMKEKWKNWMLTRRGMKKAKDFGAMFNEQIEFLSGYSEATAMEILSASIRNGWQGLFEPKATSKGAVKNEVVGGRF